MNKSTLVLIFTLVTMTAWSQTQAPAQDSPHKGHIFGVVKDSTTNQVVEFANVALNDPETNRPLNGAVCDLDGKFSITKIAPGSYNLVISFIGFQSKIIPGIKILDKKTEVDMGTINLGPIAKLLKEVTVEGQRTLIEEKVDRTVYNAEQDQTTRGGDATDVLKRVPMLSVDMDGNVSLRGSQNIKVLINNKPSTISANSVADALKQIPADQIKSVEVITSPSAKYDAEGSAGIINIITKKNNLQGATLNVDGSAGYRGSNLGLNGSYRKGKMGFNLGGFGRAGYNIPGQFTNDQITQDSLGTHDVKQTAATRNTNLGGNYTLGWDYDIDKNNSLAASARLGARNNYTYQDDLMTQTLLNGTPVLTTNQNVKTSDLSNTFDGNLTYTHLFAKPQREFNLLGLYSRNNRTYDFVRSTLSSLSEDSLRAKNNNTSFNQEITLQADYQTPIGKTQLVEMGAKDIMRKVSSDYKYFNAIGPDFNYVPNPLQAANVFNYNQNITAGYLSYTLSLPSGYSVKAGGRYEYTTINANFQNASEINTNIPSYGVLVPSLNLSKKLKSGGTLKVAYNRRIQRPSIQFLNPNVQSSNPYSVTVGNPTLHPEYTNNYEAGYSTFIKGTSLNFNGFMRNTTGSITAVKSANGPQLVTTYQNIGQEDAYGFSFFANVNISGKFTLNGGTDVYYAVLKNNLEGSIYNASNQGWVYNARLFGNYTIGNGWGLQFFSFYRGRQVQLQGIQGGFGIYSLALRKDILNKKGSLGFGAENFATPSIRIKSTTYQPGLIDQSGMNVIHNMNFKVTFSYRIGKMTFDAPKKRHKSISNDDMKEGGGDNGANAVQGAGQQGGTGGGAGAAGAAGAVGAGQNGKGGQGQPGQGPGQGQGKPGQGQFKQQPKRDSTNQNFNNPDFKKDSLNNTKSDSTKTDSLKNKPKDK